MFTDEERNERRFGECPKCKEKAKWLYFYMGMRGEKLVSGWVCLDCLNEMKRKGRRK